MIFRYTHTKNSNKGKGMLESARNEDFHPTVQPIGEQKVVSELEPVRLHGVRRAVVEVRHLRVVKV